NPWLWFHSQTEASNDSRVNLIRLGANEFALCKSLDAGRIDNAYRVTGFMKIDRYIFSIVTCGFQAGMDLLNSLFLKPDYQCLKTFHRILTGFMSRFPI